MLKLHHPDLANVNPQPSGVIKHTPRDPLAAASDVPGFESFSRRRLGLGVATQEKIAAAQHERLRLLIHPLQAVTPAQVEEGLAADVFALHLGGVEVAPLGEMLVDPGALAFDDLLDLGVGELLRHAHGHAAVALDEDADRLAPAAAHQGVVDVFIGGHGCRSDAGQQPLLAVFGQGSDLGHQVVGLGLQLGDAAEQEQIRQGALELVDLVRLLPEVDDADATAQHLDHLLRQALDGLGVLRRRIGGEGDLDDQVAERRHARRQGFAGWPPAGLGFVSQLLQLDRKLHPIVLVLANERFQLVAEPAVENRVLVQVDLAVFTDGVLHLAGLGLGIGLAGEVSGRSRGR